MIHTQDEEVKQARAIKMNPKEKEGKGSFMQKLYQDDDEYDQLKVMGMIDEEDQEVNDARGSMVKRKTKIIEKKFTSHNDKVDTAKTRIGRLALRKGTTALFAVCEIGKDYLIVNHTRNTKGYIQVKEPKQFHIGQLVLATVDSEIGGAETGQIYNLSSGKAGLNRKVQLTFSRVNKQLSEATLSKGMMLQTTIDSKEAKGYILSLGFKDNCKGFLKFTEDMPEYKKGQMLHVTVRGLQTKVVKCEKLNKTECV